MHRFRIKKRHRHLSELLLDTVMDELRYEIVRMELRVMWIRHDLESTTGEKIDSARAVLNDARAGVQEMKRLYNALMRIIEQKDKKNKETMEAIEAKAKPMLKLGE